MNEIDKNKADFFNASSNQFFCSTVEWQRDSVAAEVCRRLTAKR